MKVITWNVNSLRARAERTEALLQRHAPDVLCLQELKAEEGDLPLELFWRAGYRVVSWSQKTYNGVAIVARTEPTGVVRGLSDGVEDDQARLISAVVGGIRFVCVYVPNGGELFSDKYTYKLQWLSRLRAFLDLHHRKDEPLVVCGDFNVAPEERDVHDPAAWLNESLFHPTSREALQNVLGFGLTDSLRVVTQEAGLFSWWDYRMLGFPKNRGLRIDHLFITQPLVARCKDVRIDRNERKGKQPSDHAPVVMDLVDG